MIYGNGNRFSRWVAGGCSFWTVHGENRSAAVQHGANTLCSILVFDRSLCWDLCVGLLPAKKPARRWIENHSKSAHGYERYGQADRPGDPDPAWFPGEIPAFADSFGRIMRSKKAPGKPTPIQCIYQGGVRAISLNC